MLFSFSSAWIHNTVFRKITNAWKILSKDMPVSHWIIQSTDNLFCFVAVNFLRAHLDSWISCLKSFRDFRNLGVCFLFSFLVWIAQGKSLVILWDQRNSWNQASLIPLRTMLFFLIWERFWTTYYQKSKVRSVHSKHTMKVC